MCPLTDFETEPEYSQWSLRSLFGGIQNLGAEAETEITAALKLNQRDKAARIFERYTQRAEMMRELIKEKLKGA